MKDQIVKLRDSYQMALKEKEIHSCTGMDLSGIDVDDLFKEKNALQFIMDYFASSFSNPSHNKSCQKMKIMLKHITAFRAQHTVSSFLLGVAIKENLRLDVRDWIRIGSRYSSDPTFGFFWSLICLTHDVAYKWERNASKYLDKYSKIEAFIKYNKIEYNLLNETKHKELIQSYYRYRIEQNRRVDHGITGAILVYDALMTFYEENKDRDSICMCGITLRKSFPDFCLRVAETVALHNMWRATKNKETIYLSYHLNELIPDGNNKEKAFYDNDVLLFMLGLIDTIDPIKAFCNSEGSAARYDTHNVLNEFYLSYSISKTAKTVKMVFDKFDSKRYSDMVKGMESWLGVRVDLEDGQSTVSILSGKQIENAA